MSRRDIQVACIHKWKLSINSLKSSRPQIEGLYIIKSVKIKLFEGKHRLRLMNVVEHTPMVKNCGNNVCDCVSL